jgi:protein N-terminal amidase
MDLNPFPPADWRGADGPYELASHAWSTRTDVLVLLNAWLDSGHDPADVHDWHTLNYWAARLRPLWDIDTENTGAPKQTLVVICNRTGTENGNQYPFSVPLHFLMACLGKTFAGTSAVLRLVHGSGKPQLLHMMGRREEGIRVWNIAMSSRW